MKTFFTVTVLASLIAAGSFGNSASADDYFLTIGGGYSPTGNQISLEKNVNLFQVLLSERYKKGTSHDIFFSDGTASRRDLQYKDPNFKIPRVNRLLSQVFGQTRYLEYRYRDHRVTGIKGMTSRTNLDEWFKKTGSQLKQGDRLFIYITAHGGRSKDRKNQYNTSLYLWNNYRLAMTDFTKMLDKIPNSVPVTSVMVQCFSGGFANLIFENGDAKKTFKPNRCGFFATVHSRPAAGCTADVNEESYEEYSSYFWQAIRGRTRTGKAINIPDYDKNGTITFDEAHAYALLISSTIDISITTSDRYLRVYSQAPDVKKWSSSTSPSRPPSYKKPTDKKSTTKKSTTKKKVAKKPKPKPKPIKGLISPKSSYEKLLAMASPAEKAVLIGLSKQLGLKSSKRHSEAVRAASNIMREKRKFDTEQRKKAVEYKSIASSIRKSLLNQWPELANSWSPDARQSMRDDSPAIIQLIEKHAKYKKFVALKKETDSLSDKSLDKEREWAKSQRLIRTLENIALAANLSKVASPKVLAQYRQLKRLEKVALPKPITRSVGSKPIR